jgi:hypothetical protein
MGLTFYTSVPNNSYIQYVVVKPLISLTSTTAYRTYTLENVVKISHGETEHEAVDCFS